MPTQTLIKRFPFKSVVAFVRTRIAAAQQQPSQIFQRVPGDRFLSGPEPALTEAQEEWQFALLSVAAYGRSNPKRRAIPAGRGLLRTAKHVVVRETEPPNVPDVDAELKELGWARWRDFPDQKLKAEMHISHLRAEVWEHIGQGKIVVAFGGTVFTSGKDWTSNLRWFIPGHKDEYTTIVKHFGPDFVDIFSRKMQTSPGEHLKKSRIFATGHSLGGGLAQQFAYALPVGKLPKKVEQVYAFDPSPVTGFFSVCRKVRNQNRKNLRIVRSYERGEVLAIIRSFTSMFIKQSKHNPEIRGVRFSLFYSMNPLKGHSMLDLAEKMKAAAQSHTKSVE